MLAMNEIQLWHCMACATEVLNPPSLAAMACPRCGGRTFSNWKPVSTPGYSTAPTGVAIGITPPGQATGGGPVQVAGG